MNDPIIWTPSTAKVGDLLPKGWKRNPRYSTPSTVDGLKKLIEQFGQYNRILVDGNGIVDGHQRVAAWYKLYGKSFEALTNEANRPLTEKEREDFTLLNHAGGMGFWNFDELTNWEPEALVLGGFDQDALTQTRAEMAFLIEMLGDGEGNSEVPDVDFAEYDETAADDVKMCECPECGHKFPA